MFKRVLLGLFFLVSIAWIGYIGFGIFTATNDYSEIHVFNQEDGQLLVVNRPSEVDFSAIQDFQSSPSIDIVNSLSSNYSSGFFSSKRAHFILVNTENWDEQSISDVFNREDLSIDTKKKTLSLGSWKGSYKMNRLYLSNGKFAQNKEPLDAFVYDKKASASVLNFGGETDIESVVDIYFKSNGKVEYITRNEQIKQGKQVKDEVLFGAYISRKSSSYHFYERDFFATIDKDFAKGPMVKWLQAGFVQTNYNGKTILVSDYIDGQDPILILNDLQQTIDETKFKTQLTSTFPRNGNSYVVKYLEDLVVICENENTCDLFIADYKLGNTISQSNSARKRVFGDLPQSVSERFISDDLRLSKAVYQGYLLETRFGKSEIQAEAQDESIAMSCNFDVIDFHAFAKPGTLAALGSKGEMNFFKNGKLAWSKTTEQKIFGDIQVVELHGGGSQYILINSEDAIYLWDLNGNSAPGFPINLEESAINEVKFYRWKDKGYFLITNARNTTLQFDSEGRELTVFKSKVVPNRKIDVWSSQRRLFFGFASTTEFEMFEVAKKTSLRTFSIAPNSRSIKTPNQLFQYGFDGDQFCQFNQKGTKTIFEIYNSGKLLPVSEDSKNPTLIVRARNSLHFINQKGIEFGKLRLPFNEIEHVDYFSLNSGKTVVSVIDGLENNVYLYNITGTKLTERSLEGKTKVNVSSNGDGLIITTVVDNYVIQYFEN